MEKYARQSIAEGLTADKVEITTDSELYKILNLHYNRNNQIEVKWWTLFAFSHLE